MPPAVQAALAPRAAAAGRAILLEKPLGAGLDEARAVADAVAEHGMVSQLVLTKRYRPATRAFLAEAAGREVTGARSCYLHGAFLGAEFVTSWRLEHGALLDLGPHLLDLLDTAVAPIVSVRATGDPRRRTELTCQHENGAVSQASLSGCVRLPQARTRIELFGPGEELVYDTDGIDHEEAGRSSAASSPTRSVRAGAPASTRPTACTYRSCWTWPHARPAEPGRNGRQTTSNSLPSGS